MDPTQPRAGIEEPSYLTKKLKELERIEETIMDLQSQLIAAETRRDALKNELALCKANSIGIQNLPPELLCIVFSMVDDAQASRNHRLSLVCRSWQALINGTAYLWNQIVVKWDGEIHRLVKQWDYIDLCLERSKHTLLDITVDLYDLIPYDYYVSDVMYKHFDQLELDPLSLVEVPDNERARGWPFQVIHGPNRHHYDRLLETTVLKLGQVTSGSGWRSLRLLVPGVMYQEGLGRIFHEVAANSAQLVEFTYLRNYGGTTWSVGDLAINLPSLPALRRFKTDQQVTFTDSAVLCGLEHLALLNSEAVFDFLWTTGSSFSALRYLSIMVYLRGMVFEFNNSVTIPTLRTLKIVTDTPTVIWPLFITPNLQTLEVEDLALPSPIASVFSTVTEFIIKLYALTENGIEKELAASLRSTLDQGPHIVNYTIRCEHPWCLTLPRLVTPAIARIRSEGSQLASLSNIIILCDHASSFQELMDVSVGDHPVGEVLVTINSSAVSNPTNGITLGNECATYLMRMAPPEPSFSSIPVLESPQIIIGGVLVSALPPPPHGWTSL